MKYNRYGLMFQAANAESFVHEDADLNLDVSNIQRVLENLDELDNDINYTAEMVNVIGDVQDSGEMIFMVEMENLQKYMESAEIEDVSEALWNIAECNNINVTNMCVVIESEDTIMHALNEAKKARKVVPGKMKQIKNTADILDMMVTKGIKVAKRKSKSGKKRKKSKK